jgi:anti-sigma factor RsiW
MGCAKTLSGILPYIDGRLQAKGRAEIEEHLATCAYCRLRAEQFRAVAVLLDQLPVIEPSLAFDARVRALAAGAAAKQGWWPLLKASTRVALAASVLLLAALWLGFYERSRVPALPWSDSRIADEQMMQDLPVLEDHEVLSNFEP